MTSTASLPLNIISLKWQKGRCASRWVHLHIFLLLLFCCKITGMNCKLQIMFGHTFQTWILIQSNWSLFMWNSGLKSGYYTQDRSVQPLFSIKSTLEHGYWAKAGMCYKLRGLYVPKYMIITSVTQHPNKLSEYIRIHPFFFSRL